MLASLRKCVGRPLFRKLSESYPRHYSKKAKKLQHHLYQSGVFMGHLEPENQKIFTKPSLVDFDGFEIVHLANSWITTAFTTVEGMLFAFGYNEWGQVGTNFQKEKTIPLPTWIQVLETVKIMQVAPGRAHTVVRTNEGKLISMGTMEFGQLGNGQMLANNSQVPVKVEALEYNKIIDIAAGLDHSLALSESGEVFSWGFNREGQLGLGQDEEDVSTPTKVDGIKHKINRVFAGLDYSFALTESGEFYGWGNGENFQLGNSVQDVKLVPHLISIPGEKVVKLAPGATSCLALTEDGSVYSWGLGLQGQLGHGDENPQQIPKKIEYFNSIGKKVIDISGKGSHYLAMTEDGILHGFGYASDGRLGIETEAQSLFIPTPLEFFKNSRVLQFACGIDNIVVLVEE